MENLAAIIPILLYMAGMLAISFYVRSKALSTNSNFLKRYFIGNNEVGGFVLAMTMVATYSSVSTFVGGAGMAWHIGFGWAYMAIVQVTAVFLVLGIFGKRMAMLSRKLNAVTVVDIIRARFNSNLLANLSAFVIVLFFSGTMVAQLIGGAKLFEAVTGYSYLVGLLLFGIMVVIYTSVGGFRAVVLTDTVCALVMMLGIVLLIYAVLDFGGGYANVVHTITTKHSEMIDPLSHGNMPWGLYLTQWLLVGICTIALPQSAVRGMSYKNTKSLVKAMVLGTFVLGFINSGINIAGILAHGVMDGDLKGYGGADNIIPTAIVTLMDPTLASIAIIGPLAASISTISSLLLVGTSSIIKDIYVTNKKAKGEEVSDKKVQRLSVLVTFSLGIIVFLIAVNPPQLIWIINMFAFGGLETAFFWVLIFGLFWKRANKTGAMFSLVGGTLAYCLTMFLGFKLFDLHQITIGITASLVLFIIGTYLGKSEDEKTLEIFFPSK